MLISKIKSVFNVYHGLSFFFNENNINIYLPDNDYFKLLYSNSECLYDEEKNLHYFSCTLYTLFDERSAVEFLEFNPFFEVKTIEDITDKTKDVDFEIEEKCFVVELYFLKED